MRHSMALRSNLTVHLTVRTLSVTMNPHDIFRLPAVNATGLRYAFFLCLHHLAAPEWNIGVSHACVPPRKEMVVTKKSLVRSGPMFLTRCKYSITLVI